VGLETETAESERDARSTRGLGRKLHEESKLPNQSSIRHPKHTNDLQGVSI
jgi:hypothetical protein